MDFDRSRLRAFCIAAAMALFGYMAALPVRLEAQCALSGSPISFEPYPPGVSRAGTPYLGGGFSSNLALFQSGSGGPYRLLMQESFGYSVLDLTNPVNPTAIYYHDIRFPLGGPNSVPNHGDGQNNVQTISVSPDGYRIALSTVGPAAPFNTVVGSPSGSGFMLWGDFNGQGANGTLIQHVGSRYIAYDIFPNFATASDITTLPSSFAVLNKASEIPTWPGGYLASIAGNYLLYMSGGTVRVINASNPGPLGSITANYPQTTITSADFPGGRSIAYYTAAIDPVDSTKLWVLVELNALFGENSPSYGLLTVASNLAKTSAGPVWRVPSQAGESWWANPGASSALIASNGSLFALMWAQRATPTRLFELYSTTAAAWGSVNSSAPPGKFDIAASLYGNFSPGQPMRGFSIGGAIYAYLPTGSSAYMIPMSCVSINSPAVTSMIVANQAGATLANGDTVFLGDQITITPSVIPSLASRPLTGFGWNFDFDFHAGAAYDDGGAGTSPRLRAPDNGAFGNPPAPPGLITVVGPCDYQVGGTDPGSGTGCWNSVRTNGAYAGGTPDFTGAEAAGSSKPVTFALEANNAFGSTGPSFFTLNWEVPAPRLQSTLVLSGQPLVSGSDGHPTAAGFKWYFGASPGALTRSSCTGPTCVPTLDTKGTYLYWLTATYANGYVTPDYQGTTAMGTYTVTDFAPSFAVNGSTSGPVTAITNQSLNAVNSSQRGTGISATYQYSLCLTPCSDSYQAWSAMTDPPTSGSPPTSATIPVPATPGSYALKIKVSYTGGTAYWPDPSGVTFFPVNAESPLVVTASVNPGSAIVGYNVTFSCSATGGFPPYSYEWRSPISFVVGTQQTYQATSNVPGNVQAYCFVTDSQPSPASSSASATATFVPGPPVSVSVTASPSPTQINQTVTFSCNATGGVSPYSYEWRSPISFVVGTQQTYQTTSSVVGSVQAYCFVSDSQPVPASSSASATATFTERSNSLFVLNPCRVLDTRNTAGPLGGPAIQPAGSADRTFAVASSCGIPSDAIAISANVTVTNVSAPGIVSIYRGNGQRTGTNTVPLVPGRTRANNAILQLATDGSGTIKAQNTSTGAFDLIIDVNGFFR